MTSDDLNGLTVYGLTRLSWQVTNRKWRVSITVLRNDYFAK